MTYASITPTSISFNPLSFYNLSNGRNVATFRYSNYVAPIAIISVMRIFRR